MFQSGMNHLPYNIYLLMGLIVGLSDRKGHKVYTKAKGIHEMDK